MAGGTGKVRQMNASRRQWIRDFLPRYFRGRHPIAPVGAVYLLVVAAIAVFPAAGRAARHAPASVTATIAYAVDGDTLRIEEADGDLEYVRLIGIDTPESVKEGTPVECGADAASRSMDALAPEGATVRLVYDGERQDNYGRILAHAYVDGRQLELAQLRRGWAYVYRYRGRTFAGLTRYYVDESKARSEDRGVWGRCGGDFHSAEPGTQD
jgi:micrococcal nuclease